MDFRDRFCIFLLFIMFNFFCLSGASLIVKTSKGRVKGVEVTSKGNTSNKMLMFKGIPYAEPPVGKLRFKAPSPAQSWGGTKTLSHEDKPVCPQSNLDGNTRLLQYSENCLFINVYSPSDVTKKSNLPVMVWIHGGGFMIGSGRYSTNGPDYLVDQGVIVVTLNYRIGALGFLSLGSDDVPGNAGLKDQVLALKWVQEEISNFGGDPNKVTIFGESAGAASVHYHILSEMSKGLFQRAIGESGVPLAEWPFLSTGFVERATQLASALNCTTADNEVNVICLQNAQVNDILDKQSITLTDEETISTAILPFLPTLELNTKSSFLPDIPENLLKDPANKVPMIMGVNLDEGMAFISDNAEFYTKLPDKMQYFIPKSTRDQIDNYTLNYKVKELEKFYFNNTTPSLQNLQGYINLLTDKMFAIGTSTVAKDLAQHNSVYLYHFDFDGNFRYPSPIRTSLNLKGVSHVDELGYIFVISQINTEGYAEDSPEKKMLRKMVKLWTNFAKFGVPTPEASGDPDLENAKWTPISGNTTNYLVINGNLTMSTDNFQQQGVEFWESLISTENVSPSPITPPLPTKPHTTTPPTTSPTTIPTTPTSPTTTAPTSPNTTTPPTTTPTTMSTTTPPAPTIPPPPPSQSNSISVNLFTFVFTTFIIFINFL